MTGAASGGENKYLYLLSLLEIGLLKYDFSSASQWLLCIKNQFPGRWSKRGWGECLFIGRISPRHSQNYKALAWCDWNHYTNISDRGNPLKRRKWSQIMSGMASKLWAAVKPTCSVAAAVNRQLCTTATVERRHKDFVGNRQVVCNSFLPAGYVV